jgi:predicted phosphodiesterase
MGRDISHKYTFKPINTSDGLNYYSLSDIHMAGDAAAKAASYDEGMELLVLAGDIVSMMDTFNDANLVNEYAHAITKGSIPVIYARGNHEIKGKYSEEFHKFVGASGEKFYYNINLEGLYGVVLDIGEDHADEYWEYYDTAYYDEYRNEQIEFLKEEVKLEKYKNADYRLAVSHIPVAFINSRRDHVDPKTKMTEELNKMGINMMISGHQHDLYVFEPGTIKYNEDGKMAYNSQYSKSKPIKSLVTDHNFLNILVSKRGHSQTDNMPLTDYSSHIGMQTIVDFKNNKQTCIYNDSDGKKIPVVNAFVEGLDYGTEMVFDLSTGKHI